MPYLEDALCYPLRTTGYPRGFLAHPARQVVQSLPSNAPYLPRDVIHARDICLNDAGSFHALPSKPVAPAATAAAVLETKVSEFPIRPAKIRARRRIDLLNALQDVFVLHRRGVRCCAMCQKHKQNLH